MVRSSSSPAERTPSEATLNPNHTQVNRQPKAIENKRLEEKRENAGPPGPRRSRKAAATKDLRGSTEAFSGAKISASETSARKSARRTKPGTERPRADASADLRAADFAFAGAGGEVVRGTLHAGRGADEPGALGRSARASGPRAQSRAEGRPHRLRHGGAGLPYGRSGSGDAE